jgi:queuosine precursor transporter
LKTRYYTMFVMLYITIICITILMAYKPLQFDSLIFPGGIFVFPIVYFINDAMSEIYGYREAKKLHPLSQ